MDKKNILQELKNAFPKLEISMLSTNQRGDRKLIVVKGFSDTGNIDDWSVDTIYPIWSEMTAILEQYESGMRDFRLLFIRGNQFMLHSPDVGLGNAFREYTKPIQINVYGYGFQQHYVGECSEINDVVKYLTQTKVRF